MVMCFFFFLQTIESSARKFKKSESGSSLTATVVNMGVFLEVKPCGEGQEEGIIIWNWGFIFVLVCTEFC